MESKVFLNETKIDYVIVVTSDMPKEYHDLIADRVCARLHGIRDSATLEENEDGQDKQSDSSSDTQCVS